jgi:enoyl-CoA hydratase
MNNDPILYEKIDGIAKICLNRPDRGNRINKKMYDMFVEAIDRVSNDSDIRVVIIRANGDDFCCGFDVGDPEVSLNANEEGCVTWEARRANTQEELDLWLRVHDMRKPVIAATQGLVIGGGWLIAMMADCIVAADNVEFDNGEYAMGMSYTLYAPMDAWKLPPNIAKEKAFTGYTINAEEGRIYGLFNRVVPPDELDAAAMRLARRMLKLAPYTLTMHKELYNMAYDLQGIKQVLQYGKEIFNIAMHLPGTPESEAMWNVVKEKGPDEMIRVFAERMKELRMEKPAPGLR